MDIEYRGNFRHFWEKIFEVLTPKQEDEGGEDVGVPAKENIEALNGKKVEQSRKEAEI